MYRLLFPAQLEVLVDIHTNLLRDVKSAFPGDEDEIGTVFLDFFGSQEVSSLIR